MYGNPKQGLSSRPETACLGKFRHDSYQQAEKILKSMKYRYRIQGKGRARCGNGPWPAARMGVYKCQHCGKWHVGHQPDGRAKHHRRMKRNQFD